jgi:CMP-N-acetylneuraminic acid synthetase
MSGAVISFFIPIKKISKRIKNKNIRSIKNFKFGLTQIKITQLIKFKNLVKKNKFLNKFKFEFIVSSDSKKIKNFLFNFKDINFKLRPKKLSRDDCLDELIKYVPKVCKGDFVLWTHVTSPFFDEKSYINFIYEFLKKKNFYDSAFTANKLKSFIYNYTKKKWISHIRNKKKWPRTQDLDDIYNANNACFIAKRIVYTKHFDRLGKKPLPILVDNNKNQGFDVDEFDDFIFFKKKMENR